MTTTIKISEQNQQALFQIKNQLEKETNETLSFNDVVEVLIKKFRNLNKGQLIEDLVSLKGILPPESKEIFHEMRMHDKTREDRYISH